MNNKKLKVVWLCHFSNEAVRERLSLSKNIFENFTRKLTRKKRKEYIDFAPWITNMIVEFEKFDDVEVHIVAPHQGMIKKTEEFVINGIHYHFFTKEKSFPFNLLEKRYSKKHTTTFPRNRAFVKSFIDKIKPDIVNLIGAENPYYSITALEIKEIPILLTCQTVYSNPQRAKLQGGNVSQLRWDVEQRLFQHIDYFICGGIMYYDLIKLYKPSSFVFHNIFPSKKINIVKDVEKIFDFVWFAKGVTEKKGILNALEALFIVRQTNKDVSLLIVGDANDAMKARMNELIKQYKLSGNVSFHGHFNSHDEMLQYITQARYALLPVKLDVISGTIKESMFLGLPVVTHATSGTPRLNKDKQCVLISEIDDIEALADNMLRLMNSEELASDLIRNAKEYVDKTYDNYMITRRMVDQYKLICDNYYRDLNIPKEQLYNLDDYPEYKENHK